MKDQLDPPVPHAFAVNTFSLLLSVCILFPFAGILSDRFGRRRIMTIGGVGLCFFSPFLVYLISRGNTMLAFWSQFTMGIALSLWDAPMCAWLVESFDAEARLTSVAIGFNVAQAIAGGLTPSLATFFVGNIGPQFPGFLLTVTSLVALSGLWIVSPTSGPYAKISRGDEAMPSRRHVKEAQAEVISCEMVDLNMPGGDGII